MLPSKSTRGIIIFLFILTAVPSVFGQSLTNKIFAARAERVAFVKGDNDVAFEDVVRVIEIARRSGVERVGLMTKAVAE